MTAALRLDLHLHSTHSPDSRLDLQAAVDRLGPAGLNGFALTDHNTVDGHRELARLARENPRYWLIPGVEVSAREGHVVVLGVHQLPARGLPIVELVEWVRARNGLAILAHPFRWVHGAGRRGAESAPVAGIEGRNGRTSELANVKAELIGARRGLLLAGGSDAHEPSSVGRAFTELPEEVGSVDQLLEELRRGRGVPGGDSLGMSGRLALALRNGVLRAGRGFRPI